MSLMSPLREYTQAFAEERAGRSFPKNRGTIFHAKVGTKIEEDTSIKDFHN
jgi:hypothetical protein